MAPTDCSLQTQVLIRSAQLGAGALCHDGKACEALLQEITWLQGRLTLLRSLLRIICSSPAAPAPATLEVMIEASRLSPQSMSSGQMQVFE